MSFIEAWKALDAWALSMSAAWAKRSTPTVRSGEEQSRVFVAESAKYAEQLGISTNALIQQLQGLRREGLTHEGAIGRLESLVKS